MAVSAAVISGVVMVGSQVVAHQQRQKAKGDAARITREMKAEQVAADNRKDAAHDATQRAASSAGAVARRRALLGQQALPTVLSRPTGSSAPAPSAGGKQLIGQ